MDSIKKNYLITDATELLLIPLIILKYSKKISIIIFIFLYYFFRNPRKTEIYNRKFIYAPSYGTLENIQIIDYKNEKCYRISTFLGVLDPHLCYAPCDGIVINKEYFPGTFHPAYLGKKTEYNERLVTTITNNNIQIDVILIAGVLVRRIKSLINTDDTVLIGKEIGLIKFGSRVDIILPINIVKRIFVKPGQKITGAYTKFIELI